jgi:hypothetical protein
MLTAAIAVALTAFVVTTWLLTIASHAASGTDLANARLDAVRTGLAAGAGAGAAVGLMLAFRRQHHQEIATVLSDHDATERRITELYTKAVEQLGNDRAPVRLGGLYALERLAQDNEAHRQTIVNVICAYLRMPFPRAAPTSETPSATSGNAAELQGETKILCAMTDDSWQQESQVRLTAQRILSDHLHWPTTDQQPARSSHTRFWEGIRLDLTGATLIDFDLERGKVDDALFTGATFIGQATFTGATFTGAAWFGKATFVDAAWFDGATFNGIAWFIEATFDGDSRFGATFNGRTDFSEATFTSSTQFRGATFNGDAAFEKTTFSGAGWFDRVSFTSVSFIEATFGRPARFDGATFTGNAWFEDAAFTGDAWFEEATFKGDAKFDRATFDGDSRFSKATFSGDAQFEAATFNSIAWFDQATFSGNAQFEEASFADAARFDKATFSSGQHAVNFTNAFVRSSERDHIWPAGWQLQDNGDNGLTAIRTNNNLKS